MHAYALKDKLIVVIVVEKLPQSESAVNDIPSRIVLKNP